MSAGFNRGFLDGGGVDTQRTQARPLRAPVPLEENDAALQAIGTSKTLSLNFSCLNQTYPSAGVLCHRHTDVVSKPYAVTCFAAFEDTFDTFDAVDRVLSVTSGCVPEGSHVQ